MALKIYKIGQMTASSLAVVLWVLSFTLKVSMYPYMMLCLAFMLLFSGLTNLHENQLFLGILTLIIAFIPFLYFLNFGI